MTKFTNPFLPKLDLVVTRHAGLVEWLIDVGHIDADTPVVEHAHADRSPAYVQDVGRRTMIASAPGKQLGSYDLAVTFGQDDDAPNRARLKAVCDAHNAANVRGKHVLGVLPHHLSCEAASITEVQLDIEPSPRGRELTADETALAARGLHTYRVNRVDGVHQHSDAVSAAWRFVEEQGRIFGAGPKILTYKQRTFLGLDVTMIGSGDQQADAEIIMSRGVWRPMCRGPWIDGLGQEVEDIEPASGWEPGFEAPDGPADPGPATFE